MPVTADILSDVLCNVLLTLYCVAYFVLSIIAIQPFGCYAEIKVH